MFNPWNCVAYFKPALADRKLFQLSPLNFIELYVIGSVSDVVKFPSLTFVLTRIQSSLEMFFVIAMLHLLGSVYLSADGKKTDSVKTTFYADLQLRYLASCFCWIFTADRLQSTLEWFKDLLPNSEWTFYNLTSAKGNCDKKDLYWILNDLQVDLSFTDSFSAFKIIDII